MPLDRNDNLGENVLAFVLQMRGAFVKAGQGVSVEDKEPRDPPYLVLLRRHLRKQVIHQPHTVFNWFIMLRAQINGSRDIVVIV